MFWRRVILSGVCLSAKTRGQKKSITARINQRETPTYTPTVFAFVNGLEALRYLLPHVPFPAEIDNFIHRRTALSLHALGGAMALMTAPLQFLPGFRESNWNRHRLLGWVYGGAVLLGCCASVWMVPHAQTGWIAAEDF